MRAAALLLAAALAASAAARRLPLEVADAASVCRTGGANGQCVAEVGYCQHNAIVYCNRGAGEGCVIRDGAPVCKVRLLTWAWVPGGNRKATCCAVLHLLKARAG